MMDRRGETHNHLIVPPHPYSRAKWDDRVYFALPAYYRLSICVRTVGLLARKELNSSKVVPVIYGYINKAP